MASKSKDSKNKKQKKPLPRAEITFKGSWKRNYPDEMGDFCRDQSPMHEVTPSVVASAVRMLIAIRTIVFHVSFFIFFVFS